MPLQQCRERTTWQRTPQQQCSILEQHSSMQSGGLGTAQMPALMTMQQPWQRWMACWKALKSHPCLGLCRLRLQSGAIAGR